MHKEILLSLCLALTACGAAETDAGSDTKDETIEVPMADCPVIESNEWSAWIDAMPGPDRNGPTLHVTGKVTLPTPGYTATWKVGAMDRAMPPGQTLHLSFSPPEGAVIQMLSTDDVHFQGEATYSEYRVIRVVCGEELRAEITEIETAQ